MFQAEVRRIEKLLYRIAWSYLGNNADVEDAVQDALIKAWEKRHSRKRKKWNFYPLEDAAAKEAEPPEPEAPVLEAVKKLKPELGLLITLYYVDGYSVQDLAKTLGIPENTVKTRMRNARKQLGRTLLVEWGAEA